jgi:2,3-bisphosphoglycerate-dependent phosphoglycerate mutase
MSKLILLRHGQSVWNQKNIFTGWVDVPLSPNGIEEAFKAGEKISNIPFDVVFVSSLIRSKLTAMLALSKSHIDRIPCVMHEDERMKKMSKVYDLKNEKTLLPVYEAWELNERMYGTLQGLNKEETLKKYGEAQFRLWRRSYHVNPPEGESLKMTAERAVPFFEKKIVDFLKNKKNVFIAAHGNSLRAIIMHIEKLSEDEVLHLELPTGEPICYEYDAKLGFRRQSVQECNESFKHK